MSLWGLFRGIQRSRYPRPSLDTVLVGDRVILRVGDPEDWRSWRVIREASRSFLVPYEPAWPANPLAYEYFCSLLRRHWREWRDGLGYSFQICLRTEAKERVRIASFPDDAMREVISREPTQAQPEADYNEEALRPLVIGGIALNDVQRGIAQKGTLGYWIGQPYANQGLMAEAAELVCRFAYDVLELHRVEAACVPTNEPSKRLLQKVGFEQEGYAKSYLKINGTWADHILWGRVGEKQG